VVVKTQIASASRLDVDAYWRPRIQVCVRDAVRRLEQENPNGTSGFEVQERLIDAVMHTIVSEIGG
jgi:hypothetical protein